MHSHTGRLRRPSLFTFSQFNTMRSTILAALAALLLTAPFCARRIVSPLPEAQAPVSTMRPNAFIRVGETSIYHFSGGAGPDTPTGYTGTITINRKANAITLVTGAQISVVGVDLYQDERAVVVLFSVLPDGSYQHIIKPVDGDVKVGDVVVLWIAGNF